MKLLRLKVEGFGALKGDIVFDPRRVTVVVDDNERGKTTLLAAVAAALYGLENNRTVHRILTPLERWRPWDGGPYRLELEVEGEGERYTIRRDFDRGTVEVKNARGQEVTQEFREGKGDYPVGRKLCGLDADEFAKSALVLQHELDEVVPSDPAVRRTATLHSRLESAADTRVGDTNATEALSVLDEAARKYTAAELDSTVAVDTAIQRLELLQQTLEADLKALEHDHEGIAGPLEGLIRLGDEEQGARERMRQLDHERRDSLADDVRRQLAEHAAHRAEVERWRAEAESLASAVQLSANAETEFRETVTRLEEAQRNLAKLEEKRQEELAREREKRQKELGVLAPYASAGPADADRCIALAAELKRVAEEDASVRTAVFTLRESLASQGHDPERIQLLTSRFGDLSDARQRLLRSHSERALAYQTEVAGLERARTESNEELREIDAIRQRWRAPAWLLTALGLAGTLAGAIVWRTGGVTTVWVPLLAAGGVMLVIGVFMFGSARNARNADRFEALRRLTEAQRRLNQMRDERAASSVELAEMAASMGYRDQVDLLREWGEFDRLMADSAPALRAQERLSALDARRKTATASATTLLAPLGGGTPNPAELERAARAIRQALGVRQALGELEAGWSWLDEEREVAEATVSGLKERAVRILQSAGLEHDPALALADHAQALAGRMQAHARHRLLTSELIPQAERRLLPAGKLADLEAQLELIDAEHPVDEPGAAGRPPEDPNTVRLTSRAPLEIETESRRAREALEDIARRRTELREQVAEVTQRYQQSHPERSAQRERVARSLAHARRFKAAIELARGTIQQVATDTHRRWSEFLGARVKELLDRFGAGIGEVRFGDDLDFSIRLPNGQQVSRGRADLQLSAGARDQLYLATRVAISEYLSRGRSPLPILLDDPFATSDDSRARTGMRMLIEVFADHQIILLTCHRGRYQALAGLDAELYRERVQWLELKSGMPAR